MSFVGPVALPYGIPSERIVLLKQVDSWSFVFFTNYISLKFHKLAADTRAMFMF